MAGGRRDGMLLALLVVISVAVAASAQNATSTAGPIMGSNATTTTVTPATTSYPNITGPLCYRDDDCGETRFCSPNGACVLRDGVAHDFLSGAPPISTTLLVIASIAFVCVCCCFAMCCKYNMTGDYLSVCLVGILVMVLCTIVAVGYGRSISGSLAAPPAGGSSDSSPGPSGGLPCLASDTPWYAPCAPYICDPRVGECLVSCSADVHCSDGFACEPHSGECHASVDGGRVTQRPLSGLFVVMVVIAITSCCICFPSSMLVMSGGLEVWELVTACCMCSCLCFMVSLGMIVSIELMDEVVVDVNATDIRIEAPVEAPSGMASEESDRPTLCSAHETCFPFLCDLSAESCSETCAGDQHCADGYQCDSNGWCSEAAPGSYFQRHRTGFIVFFCLMCCCCLATLCAAPLSDEDEELAAAVACCGVFCCVLAIVLLFAIPTVDVAVDDAPPVTDDGVAVVGRHCVDEDAVVCGAFRCNQRAYSCYEACGAVDGNTCHDGALCVGGRCVWPSVYLSGLAVDSAEFEDVEVRDTLLPTWVAVVVVAGCLLVCGVSCWSLAIFCATHKINDVNYDENDFSKWCLGMTCAIIWVGLVVAIPVYTARSTVEWGIGVDTNASGAFMCLDLDADVCRPFRCDPRVDACLTACRVDEECVDGASCVDAKCVEEVQAFLAPREFKDALPQVVAVVVISITFATVGVWLKQQYMLDIFRLGSEAHVFLMVLCATLGLGLIAWALSSAVLSGVVRDVTPEAEGTGASCVHQGDHICFPHLCDTRNNQCFETCETSWECFEGQRCSDDGEGRCEDAPPWYSLMAPLGLVAILVMALLCVSAPICCARIRQRWQEAQRERMRRELEAFQKQQDAVRPARMEIDAMGKDPTLLLVVDGSAGASASAGGATGSSGSKSHTSKSSATRSSSGSRSGQRSSGASSASASAASSSSSSSSMAAAGSSSRSSSGGYSRPGGDGADLCVICQTDPAVARLTDSCGHGYCAACAHGTLEGIVEEDTWPARCPGCVADYGVLNRDAAADAGQIPARVVEWLAKRRLVPSEFSARFIHLQILKAFDRGQVTTCPKCSMLGLIPDQKASKLNITCIHCQTEFCRRCQLLWFSHRGKSCDKVAQEMSRGEDRAQIAAVLAHAKQCPNCGIAYSHFKGHACHHIMPGGGCPNCNYSYCAECHRKWPCYSSTHGLYCDSRCHCPICPDCKPGSPCPACDGGTACPACHPPGGAEAQLAELADADSF